MSILRSAPIAKEYFVIAYKSIIRINPVKSAVIIKIIVIGRSSWFASEMFNKSIKGYAKMVFVNMFRRTYNTK